MKRNQVIIFILVGIMLFSAIATGLLFLTQDNSLTTEDELANQIEDQVTCQASSEALAIAGTPAGDWPTTVESADGLEIVDLREGNGQTAEVGNCISVHYRLSLADGTPIPGNDTFTEGQPIAFELNQGGLIDGWIQGIPGMKEGGFRRLIVPPELAYGSSERPGIPPNSVLIFDVELVKVEF